MRTRDKRQNVTNGDISRALRTILDRAQAENIVRAYQIGRAGLVQVREAHTVLDALGAPGRLEIDLMNQLGEHLLSSLSRCSWEWNESTGKISTITLVASLPGGGE